MMSNKTDKNRTVSSSSSPPSHSSYGTFHGVPTYPPPSHSRPPTHHPRPPTHHPPIKAFPQPSPPPGAAHHDNISVYQYIQEHQTVPGYAVAEGRPVRENRLPCCGLGIGWFLFIIGFFLGAIPWYIAMFILVSTKIDPRESTGYIACTIAAAFATIAIVLGVMMGGRGAWS